MEIYVNPFTDFGFKKLFGEEVSKPALIDFLNSLLPNDAFIKDLSFKNVEQLGFNINDRKAVFDIYCEEERHAGEKVKEKAMEMTKNCIEEGMGIAITAKLTGLTEQEIRQIKR